MVASRITRRPIRSEIRAPATIIEQGLARIASIRGRMSLYGVTDPTRAELMAGQSREWDFDDSYYRDGFVAFGAPNGVSDWAFTRTGAGTAIDSNSVLSSFATGLPRITDRGLLVEAAATNLALRSQDLGNATWTKTASGVSTSATPAPDGSLTAWDFAEDTTTTAHKVEQAFSLTAVPSVFSIFLAPATRGFAMIYTGTGGTFFDLSAGTVVGSTGTPHSASGAETLAGGWKRCWVNWTPPAGASTIGVYISSDGSTFNYLGAGAGIRAWGAQMETGAKPSSYIATTGATATRATDSALLIRPATPSGTLLVEIVGRGNSSDAYPIIGADSFTPLSKTATGFSTFGPTGSHDVTANVAAGETVRAALSWTPDGFLLTAKGQTPAAIPGRVGSWSYLALGWDLGSGSIRSPIRRVMLANVAATSAELQAMTA